MHRQAKKLIGADVEMGNFVLGGHDDVNDKPFVLYLFTGGGYGGSLDGDGLSNGCSTIGISKMPPIEVMEQRYPVIFDRFALHEGSGGAGEHRGGFGVDYSLRLYGGSATAAFLGDHGRFGPPGVLGGQDGGCNRIRVHRGDDVYSPPHYSKDSGIVVDDGDYVAVSTPGGGGYGEPFRRDAQRVATDVRRGYYTPGQARQRFGVSISANGEVEPEATRALRAPAAADD